VSRTDKKGSNIKKYLNLLLTLVVERIKEMIKKIIASDRI
jgi:hypothetical protein